MSKLDLSPRHCVVLRHLALELAQAGCDLSALRRSTQPHGASAVIAGQGMLRQWLAGTWDVDLRSSEGES